MKRENIDAMAAALKQVAEKKMDPVDKKDAMGKFDNRKDKDIDNDGDTDKSDKYLHKRRKAVTKAVTGGKSQKEVETQVQEEAEELEELSKKTLGSYAKKAHKDAANKKNNATQAYRDALGSKKTTANDFDNIDKVYHKGQKRSRYVNKAIDRLTKEETQPMTALERYKAKKIEEAANATTGPEAMKTVTGPAKTVQGSKEVKQGMEKSSTKDTSKLDKKTAPPAQDANKAIASNQKEEDKSQKKAVASQTDDVNKKPAMKESTDINEDYQLLEQKYVDRLLSTATEIMNTAKILHSNHTAAKAAMKRISAAYAKNKQPSEADRKAANKGLYDCKYVVRSLEDALDSLIQKLPSDMNEGRAIQSGNTKSVAAYEQVSRFGKPVELETRKPTSVRDALAMMESRDAHTKGATPPQAYDDNWSKGAKDWADKHPTHEVPEADINKVVEKNKQEVGLSLQRTVNYRHNDNKQGDKKPVGNDGK